MYKRIVIWNVVVFFFILLIITYQLIILGKITKVDFFQSLLIISIPIFLSCIYILASNNIKCLFKNYAKKIMNAHDYINLLYMLYLNQPFFTYNFLDKDSIVCEAKNQLDKDDFIDFLEKLKKKRPKARYKPYLTTILISILLVINFMLPSIIFNNDKVKILTSQLFGFSLIVVIYYILFLIDNSVFLKIKLHYN